MRDQMVGGSPLQLLDSARLAFQYLFQKTPHHRASLMRACAEYAQRAQARPGEPLSAAERHILDGLDQPADLEHRILATRRRGPRPRDVALANVYAIGQHAGLTAPQTRDVLLAMLGAEPRGPTVVRDIGRLLRRGLYEAVLMLAGDAARAP
jgi:hypothetical protein